MSEISRAVEKLPSFVLNDLKSVDSHILNKYFKKGNYSQNYCFSFQLVSSTNYIFAFHYLESKPALSKKWNL